MQRSHRDGCVVEVVEVERVGVTEGRSEGEGREGKGRRRRRRGRRGGRRLQEEGPVLVLSSQI